MTLEEAIELIDTNLDFSDRQTWADLGCGNGLFTLALAHFLPVQSSIFAVDSNKTSLGSIPDHPGVKIEKIEQDFIHSEFPFAALDGVLMANSLHYVKDKPAFIEKIGNHTKRDGLFLAVEYDTDIPNRYVPYPAGFKTLQELFAKAGYHDVKKLHAHPSIYRNAGMYSAMIRMV